MTFSIRVRVLLATSRPLCWMIAPSIWFAGRVHSGTETSTLHAAAFLLVLTFPTCIVTFGLNDVYDYESDIRNPRKCNPWTHGGALAPEYHGLVIWAARIATAVTILTALLVGSKELAALTLAFLCFLWLYSTPPLRLKERPVLDSISNGLICWLCWACGYVFDGRKSCLSSTGNTAIQGRLVFFLASALHSLAAVIDVQADTAAGHRTIATVMGMKFSIGFSLICLVSASILVTQRSHVRIANIAGILMTLVLPFVSVHITQRVIRLMLVGCLLGTFVWVVETMVEIQLGRDRRGAW